MDAQKISEAASTLKKVENAEKWFHRIMSENEDRRRGVIADTVGNATHFDGHGEAKHYLRLAMDQYRETIIETACDLAAQDKIDAQQVIREEAGS